MRRNVHHILTACLLASIPAGLVVANPPDGVHRETARELTNPRDYLVGDYIPNLAFPGIDGRHASLAELAGAKAIVIAFRETTCPISKRYGPRLASIEAAYADRDVVVIYVNPSAHDSLDAMRAEHQGYAFQGCYVADRSHAIARTLRAERSTEVFVLDPSRTLRYRGAVDDQYGIGVQLNAPRSTFLRDALDAILAGRTVTTQATTAPGCLIAIDHTPLAVVNADITWHRDISRIVQDNCMACHRSGGAAPFALDSPDALKHREPMIRYVLEHDIMPPWHATDSAYPFRNDRRLAERDEKAIGAWLDAGGPVGDPADSPTPRSWPDGWEIGTPDAVFELPIAYRVPAEGSLDYRYTYVKTNFAKDRWVQAVEIKPSAPEVVHHALLFLEDDRRPGESRRERRRRWQGGLGGYFAGLVPGQGPTVYPEGFGKLLPAGATLKFQMHYTPNGTETFDQTQVAFVFCDEPPEHHVNTSGVANTDFQIPPGADNHVVTASATFKSGGTVAGFSPHMHWRGKAFKIDLTFPDGTTQTVLDVPRYDFNWQTMYELVDPLEVPGGTTMTCTAWFDNSENNAANPDASQAVEFGEQTWDEMMIGYFEWWR